MVYLSEGAKWKAYQFSDPFAAGSFFVCNKLNKYFCRPDCESRPITNLKSEIKFVTNQREAISLGYTPCEYCEPLSFPTIDVNLLIKCVAATNKNIGFLPPLLDENEEKNNQKIKENLLESKKLQEQQQIIKTINSSGAGRRSSVPVISYDGKFSKDFEATSLSKNDSDHYRLVDLACRHLALAAAMNIFQPQSPKCPSSPEEGDSPSNSKKRRRRGGVLGFKELAAKSKLSAWHFHRVFKSVTGLTPKTYGDKCWEFIKNFKESGEYTSFRQDSEFQSPIAASNNDSSVPTSPEFSLPPSKKVRLSLDSAASNIKLDPSEDILLPPNQVIPQPVDEESPLNTMMSSNNDITGLMYTVPQSDSFEINQPLINNNFNMFNEQQPSIISRNSFTNNSRALSAPDLTKFNNKTQAPSLFEHYQKLEDNFEDVLDLTNTSTFNNAPITDSVLFNDAAPKVPNVIDEFSNLIDSNIDDFNFNFQSQLEAQNDLPLGDLDVGDLNTFSAGLSPELIATTNVGF